ncbi:hypothetical protein ACFQV2_25645 [Actinokineospora soli]|uniref:IclR-ED domain-containing protein n=1 Tax=Actinokineospora soli TaxID=1048753 RepID=A0ABW2TT91_9PSEU
MARDRDRRPPGHGQPAALRALSARDQDEGLFVARAEVGGHVATGVIPVPRAAKPQRVVGLAAPVRVYGDTVAAVSLVVPADRFDGPAVGGHLRSTTGMLARKLALTSLFCD